ncbi:hypothetical protein E1301_Tti013344 [Triplophysa tibetana]|uniref:Uncharacterized protein n=1 Tax=Triplophysa tibetana TaxID=1572043 RepID=A0A5A9N0R5_9TELE|nr:hypothetical protein E1301_Tti013344 [Triplophysa tibetana]
MRADRLNEQQIISGERSILWNPPPRSRGTFCPSRIRHSTLLATHHDRQRLANNVKRVSEGPDAGETGENKKQPSSPSECNGHRSQQTGTAARWDPERTKAVLLLIDCKISRASLWDQRKTGADGAGLDTLAERSLSTC